jgi:ABC-type phosphate transport system permease subunit
MSRPAPRDPNAPRNELGVAALLVGMVALISCWLMVGIPFGVAAIITGDMARARVKRGEANNPRTALTGMVLGSVAIVAGLVAVGYFAYMDAHKQ